MAPPVAIVADRSQQERSRGEEGTPGLSSLSSASASASSVVVSSSVARRGGSIEDESEGGDNNDVVVVGVQGGPKKVVVWDFTDAVQKVLKHGNKTWKCLYCDTTYSGWNATKALAHIAKIEGKDVAACRSIKISREKLKTYAELWGANQAGNASRKRAKENHVAAVEESQQSIAVAFQNQNKRRKSVAIGEGADARGTGAGGASEPVIVRSDTSQTTVDVSNNTRLTMAIADFIHGKGLPFNVAEDPRFLLILKLAKTVPGTYKPPGRKAMGGNLLDLNYATKMKEYEERLMTDVDVYGLSLYGDGATVRRMPLINVMASGVQERSAVLEIVDCSKHLSNGGKKDAEYIAELFKPHMEQLDSKKTLIDTVFFDGASNVQKAGELLEVDFPMVTVLHGAEHVVSLFFADIAKKIPAVSTLIRRYKRLYGVFGSGAMHQPYAIFCKYSKMFNKGRHIGLLRAADTRMAGYFIALHRMLRLRSALEATVTSVDFSGKVSSSSKQDKKLRWAKAFVQNNEIWDAVFLLLRAVYPALRVLRLADRSEAGTSEYIVVNIVVQ